MTSNLASKCVDCPYRGRHVYVVGPLRFERELMADFIGTHTAARWYQAENLDAVPNGNQGVPFGQKLILVDTLRMGQDDYRSMFESHSWKTHAHNLIALFNVDHTDNVEKEAIKFGVKGFLYSDDSTEDLINGICAINSGELWISRRIMSECLQESYIGRRLPETIGHSHTLSVREIELLRALTSGGSNDMIADQMCISPHTVKTHLHNIFQKIDVSNRLQAVMWAKEHL